MPTLVLDAQMLYLSTCKEPDRISSQIFLQHLPKLRDCSNV